MKIRYLLPALVILSLLVIAGNILGQSQPTQLNMAQAPLFTRSSLPPLNMLVMGKDHKIYFSAYNDTSDLDGDGVLDVGYRGYLAKRASQTTTSAFAIDYYGYFNSYVCYSWDGAKFVPFSRTTDKTCSGYWSGDFLNYLTTSRMDALRKVLYGGYRKTDSETQTILEGAFFPQEGHSWGKEYQSVARDGYDISRYAPLSVPTSGNYHLFAVTTVQDFASSGYNGPLFRVLQNTPTRVYNWLSIEAPVAGNKCFNSSNQRVDCTAGTTLAFPGHPANKTAFDGLETNYAISDYRYGSGTAVTSINCTSNNCNPYSTANTNYMAIFTGSLNVSTASTYQFSVDGDDAIDFTLYNANGQQVATVGYYGGHGTCGCTSYSTGDVALAAGSYTFKYRMEQQGGDDKYVLNYRRRTGNNAYIGWGVVPAYSNQDLGLRNVILSTYNLTPTVNAATRQDYRVRVQVCTADTTLNDDNCKQYPNGGYKPTGILHDYGESDRMYFGLITGSQPNNIEGGVLRRNITSFSNEITANTGQFRTDVLGIARTISNLRMIGGAYGNNVTNNYTTDTAFNWGYGSGNCGGTSAAITNGNCRMWGNPIAEMMYESMRYFSGAGLATPRFVGTSGGNKSNGVTEENAMGIGTETWLNPYRAASAGGYAFCAKPFQTIISDINPSYDGDLPGSLFTGADTTTGTTPANISGFSASAEAQAIWDQQFGGSQNVFIGEVNGVTDGAPTPKVATTFGNIRGLAPEEPTKNGTYYAASVARYAHVNDINAAQNDQKVSTYAIALASPLPRFQFGNITIIPFGKTVSGTFGGDTRKPTNTIVALYIEQAANLGGTPDPNVNGGRPYASFRISYEDVEQGNDFDMDAIARYTATQNADGTVTVNVVSEYAAGSANQNLGYIISGTTKDGVYLEVRDSDSAQSTSVYSLNTPAGVDAGGCAASGAINSSPCNAGLTLSATRTFAASSNSAAVQLKDPLWYAAKFGGFTDTNGDKIPQTTEWDADGDGTPDNYFLVTNPLYLRSQLEKAFDAIQNQNGSSGSLAISGAQVSSTSFAVLPTYSSSNNGTDWVGDLSAYPLLSGGLLGARSWSAAALLPTTSAQVANRKIWTATAPVTASNRGTAVVEFKADNLGSTRAAVLSRLGYTSEGLFNVDFGASMTKESIVDYLRGDRSLQGNTLNTAPYRPRSSIMGDIINSVPVIDSKRADYGWSSATGLTSAARTSYTAYLSAKKLRREHVYVGANDGMLHAFDDAGAEVFAYVPNALLDRDRLTGLGYLANRSYQHRYYVDGKLTLADAQLGSAWSTLLVGGLGAGQKGAFGLDVTNADNFTANKVMWEVNDKSGDSDIGLVMGQPVIVPLQQGDGKWVALFGNGYNSTSGDPVLYVVDLLTGTVLSKLKPNWRVGDLANSTQMNGLGNIAVADTDNNGLVDTAYAGDLQGNVWKFNLSGATSAWSVAFGGSAPLFTARDAVNGNRQPITGGMELSLGPNGGYMVYFGTGRYFATGDSSTTDLQSVYGIWDSGTVVSSRSSLAQQLLLSSDTTTTPATRSVSTNGVNFLTQRGWYMDLALRDTSGNYIKAGERMIGNPRIQSGRIYFPTYTPGVGSDCVPGGANWIYGLNPLSGAASLGQVSVAPSSTVVGGGSTGAASSSSGAPLLNLGLSQTSSGPATYCNPLTNPDCGSSGGSLCSEQIIDPTEITKTITVLRVCGRQSWRQLR